MPNLPMHLRQGNDPLSRIKHLEERVRVLEGLVQDGDAFRSWLEDNSDVTAEKPKKRGRPPKEA